MLKNQFLDQGSLSFKKKEKRKLKKKKGKRDAPAKINMPESRYTREVLLQIMSEKPH